MTTRTLYPTVKRSADLVGAILLLLLVSPVMAAIAVAVRLRMGTPVLFRQRRPGLNETLFTCLKFRTMRDAYDAKGEPLSDEERLTSLGVFLRRTSLDELPQLWNIVRGELSFIGPRALLERYLPYYTPEEHRRHTVRPGLSGWAQIHGRNFLNFDERLKMDVWYVDHLSWRLDLRIFVRTIKAVLTQHGVDEYCNASFPPLDLQRSGRAENASLPSLDAVPLREHL